jgi:hypothetical protein
MRIVLAQILIFKIYFTYIFFYVYSCNFFIFNLGVFCTGRAPWQAPS